MMNYIPECPGSRRVDDQNRKWFLPRFDDAGRSVPEGRITFCEMCYDALPENQKKNYYMKTGLKGCNCDSSIKLLHASMIRITPKFSFGILNAETDEMLPLLPNPAANADGVYQVVVPTCTHYVIYFKIDDTHDEYFWIPKLMVGDREVDVRKSLRFATDHRVAGYKEGTDQSFFFISLSSRCKEAGMEIEDHNVSNVIEFELQLCRKVDRRVELGYDDDTSLFGGYRGLPTLGGGGLMSMRFGAPAGGGVKGGGFSFGGGATVEGGRSVGRTQARRTDAEFPDIGPRVKGLVQLICEEDDDTRFQKNLDAMHRLKREKAKKDLEELERKLKSWEEQRKEAYKRLEAAKHEVAIQQCRAEHMEKEKAEGEKKLQELRAILGNPKDHLMKFEE